MLLADLPRVLARRWYLVLVGLSATVLLCMLATAAVPLRHAAHAELLLLPSPATTGEDGNPYAGLGGLGPAGDVLSKAMTDDDTRRELRAAGFDGTYEMGPDATSSAPLILITVEAGSPAGALDALDELLARVPTRLTRLQRDLGIGERALISSTVVTRSRTPDVVRTPQLRALLVATAAGLGTTLLGSAVMDAWLDRRRQRRQTVARTAAEEHRDQARARVHGRTSARQASRPDGGCVEQEAVAGGKCR